MKQFLTYFSTVLGLALITYLVSTLLWRPADPLADDGPAGDIASPESDASSEPASVINESPEEPETIAAVPNPADSTGQKTAPPKPRAPEPVPDLESISLPVISDVTGRPSRTSFNVLRDRQVVRWFSDSDRVLVVYMSSIRPSAICVFQADTGMLLWRVETDTELHAAAVSQDGALVAVAESPAKITCYDSKTGKIMHQIAGPPGAARAERIQGLRFDSSGQTVVSAHFDRTVRSWDIANGVELSRVSVGEAGTRLHGFFGSFLLTTADAGRQFWSTGSADSRPLFRFDSNSQISEISADGRLVAATESGADSEITILNAEGGDVVRRLSVAKSTDTNVETKGLKTSSMIGGSFDASGSRFAAFLVPFRCLVWDVRSGELLRETSTERPFMNSRFSGWLSPDGSRCVLPAVSGDLEILNVDSSTENVKLKMQVPQIDSSMSPPTVFSTNGQFQAVAMMSGAIEVRDTVIGRAIWMTGPLNQATLPDGTEVSEWTSRGISGFAVTNDGRSVLMTSHSGRLQIATADERAPRDLAEGIVSPVLVALSPDDGRAFVPTSDGQILIAELDSGASGVAEQETSYQIIDDESGQCTSISFDAEGGRVALGFSGGLLQVRSVETFDTEAVFSGVDSGLCCVAFSADGRHLACTTSQGDAYLWDAAVSGDPKATLPPSDAPKPDRPTGLVSAGDRRRSGRPLQFSRDGQLLLIGRSEGIDVVDVNTGERRRQLSFSGGPEQLGYRISDRTWLAARSMGDVSEWQPTVRETLVVPTDQTCRFVRLTPDGRLLIAGGGNSELNFIEMETGDIVFKGQTETGGALSGAISPDGTRLAVCGYATGVEIWDVPFRQKVHKYYGHKARVHAVAFSPDSQLVASASEDGTVRVRDVETRRQAHSFGGHQQHPTSLLFSSDGLDLLSGTSNWGRMDTNGVMRVFNLSARKVTASLVEPFGQVGGLDVSPFDESIAIAVANKMLILRDLASLEVVREVEVESGARHPRFLCHGRLLAFVEHPNRIHVRDVLNGAGVVVLRTPSLVFDICTLPGESVLAAACEDGTVRLWNLNDSPL